MGDIIAAAKANFPDEKAREDFYVPVIKAFGAEDWDTQDECVGEDPAFDRALIRIDPDWKNWIEHHHG